MIWLTWRQSRAQAITAGVVLAVLAVILLVTGLNLARLYSGSGLTTCHGQACAPLASSFIDQVKGTFTELVFYLSIGLIYVAPGLMGMFWGAPLIAREIETGTYRLAWNQSVSRTTWLIVKVAVLGVTAIATAGLLTLMFGWWASPVFDAAAKSGGNSLSIQPIDPPMFGAQGIVPLGYAAFAFVLGVTIGLLIRRTIPAMALTLVVFAFVQVAWPNWVRPHLVAPARQTTVLSAGRIDNLMITSRGSQPPLMTIGAAVSRPDAWIISNQTINSAGQPFTGPPTQACLSSRASQAACDDSIARLHLRQLVTYDPASRFWQLQWTETAIFLAMAILLAWFCTWWIRRRRLT
jgi:ABC-type transport system involved in multi-copper enzyme maturation permease subunit